MYEIDSSIENMNAEKYFGTNELYKILGLEPSAPTNDGEIN